MAATRFSIPGFSGELIHPDDATYDEARAVFNGMIDRRPVLIARCTNNEDVAAAVKFATSENLPMSVYGGGHGVTGAAVVDAGVVVDLRALRNVTIDPNARVADYITRDVVAASPDWSMDNARQQMADRRIGRLPVIDTEGQLVGVVTLSSLALRADGEDETLETAQEVSRRSSRAA